MSGKSIFPGFDDFMKYLVDKPAYMASPFSNEDKSVEEVNYQTTLSITSILINHGIPIFSPIVYGYHINIANPEVGGSFKNWEKFDKWAISNCGALLVLPLKGLSKSEGVLNEVQYAESIKCPIFLLNVKEDGLEFMRLTKASKIVDIEGNPYKEGGVLVIH